MIKDLPELVDAGIISEETATQIRHYYFQKNPQPQNRLLIAFGILGALLIGLGIILIIAHNWDELARWFKTVLAFLPLLIGQIACAYTLLKKQESVAWREASSTFLFMSVGASISLISQIYNLGGNLASFLLVWMLLCAPLIYVMRSSIASLCYIIGITYYVSETGYWSRYDGGNPHLYWALVLIPLPHYYHLFKQNIASNFLTFHHRFIPLSILVALGTVAKSSEEFIVIAYMSLFGLFYLIGSLFIDNESNEYKKIGAFGTIAMFIGFSFKWFWQELRNQDLQLLSPEFLVAVLVSVLALLLFFYKQKRKPDAPFNPLELAFVWFILIFLSGIYSYVLATVLTNVFALAIGVFTVVRGSKQNHLGILNYGLLIITALVVCRFFDTNMTFVARGILFVLVGIGFFVANYSMLQKRRNHE
jgi:uncharacterized membrane protein